MREQDKIAFEKWYELHGDGASYHSCKLSWQAATLESADRIAALEGEVANLHTVMMAAAVEITEHWEAHCDDEGYGPANLVRRLESGYPDQYGYDAKTMLRMDKQISELQSNNHDLREALGKILVGYADKYLVEQTATEALSATPAESMAKHDDDLLEQAAEICNEMVDLPLEKHPSATILNSNEYLIGIRRGLVNATNAIRALKVNK